ncbi:MAG: hypothetical protein JWM30_2764 [Burkholderia sp.]|jgi:hypothetical protein|nr:hypothetical protein [Burkholderia sp.]
MRIGAMRPASCAALLALCLLPALAGGAPLKTIVLLDFELVDTGLDHASDAAQRERLQAISKVLRQEFIDRHFYTVLDNKPAAALIADLGSRFTLHDCNGCDADIGRALGADRILTGWVQKVSNLILNINIQIRDVQSGSVVLARSVDIRGNTDTSWLRGVRYLTRSMDEAHQGDR